MVNIQNRPMYPMVSSVFPDFGNPFRSANLSTLEPGREFGETARRFWASSAGGLLVGSGHSNFNVISQEISASRVLGVLKIFVVIHGRAMGITTPYHTYI